MHKDLYFIRLIQWIKDCSKKSLSWYFIAFFIINRKLHARLEIQHLSSHVEKYFSHSGNIFQRSKINVVSLHDHVISSISLSHFYRMFNIYDKYPILLYVGISSHRMTVMLNPLTFAFRSFISIMVKHLESLAVMSTWLAICRPEVCVCTDLSSQIFKLNHFI